MGALVKGVNGVPIIILALTCFAVWMFALAIGVSLSRGGELVLFVLFVLFVLSAVFLVAGTCVGHS